MSPKLLKVIVGSDRTATRHRGLGITSEHRVFRRDVSRSVPTQADWVERLIARARNAYYLKDKPPQKASAVRVFVPATGGNLPEPVWDQHLLVRYVDPSTTHFATPNVALDQGAVADFDLADLRSSIALLSAGVTQAPPDDLRDLVREAVEARTGGDSEDIDAWAASLAQDVADAAD